MKTLKQFQYFIAIVEHGSFTAASEHLFIAQSALSRQIKILEDELEFILFDRTEKKIQLTPAGQSFYQKLKAHLLQLESSIDVAQGIAQGRGRCLQLAHSSSIILDPPKIQALQSLCQQQGIEIEINTMSSEQQIGAVLNGSIDLGLIRPPVLHPMTDISCIELYAQPLFAAVHKNHPFFQNKSSIGIAELSGQKFVSTPHAERGGLSYLAANLCLSHGFHPQKASIRSRKMSQLALVDAGLGICLVPEEFRSILPDSVKLIALHPEPQPSKVCLIWSKNADEFIGKTAAAFQRCYHARPEPS